MPATTLLRRNLPKMCLNPTAQSRRARAELASLRMRTADTRQEQARVAHEEAIARSVWRKSVGALAAHLRTLYEQGEPDAIAILFGATSIDDAVTRLDQLQRSARLDR